MQVPTSFSLKWTPNLLADHADIFHSLWCIFCATYSKKRTGSRQATELWRRKWYSLQPMFQGNRVLSHVACSNWQEWRYYAWFRSGDDHIWPLTLHLDLLKVIRGQWPWLTHNTYLVTNLTFFGVTWGPETEYVAFLHRHVHSASLQYSMSFRAIDPVCP